MRNVWFRRSLHECVQTNPFESTLRKESPASPKVMEFPDAAKTAFILSHYQDVHLRLAGLRRPPEPGHQSFFTLFLLLQVCLRISGARHQLSPAVTIKEAIDRALIDLVSDCGITGDLDLAHSGNLSALGLRKKGGKQRLQVQGDQELFSALMAYGIEGKQEDSKSTRQECELLADILLACGGVHTSGSVFDAAMVAKGVYGGFLYRDCKIWDNVAQHPLLEEAGALYTDFFGQPIDYRHPLTKATETFHFCAAPPGFPSSTPADYFRLEDEVRFLRRRLLFGRFVR